MFEGRELDHIGVQVTDSEADAKFYMEKLGFTLKGKFKSSHGDYYTWFVTNGQITYEIYQSANIPEDAKGKVNHVALNSTDIEVDYKYCVENGYTICTNGIEEIPSRWEHGCRYFKVVSPTGEQIEFNQNL